MNRVLVIMLEDEDSRFEFYMKGVKRSNLDDTIVRYELVYDYVRLCGTGSTKSYNNRIFGDFEKLMNKLLLDGFKPVTYETMKFA